MRRRRHRRGDGQLHGAVDEGALPQPEVRPAGRRRQRTRPRVRVRPGGDGVPRRHPRGLRDRRLPAGRLPVDVLTGAGRDRRAPRPRGGGHPGVPGLSRRAAAEPVAVLPDHRRGAGAGRRRPGGQHAARRVRGRLADDRSADRRRPLRDRATRVGAGVAAHRHARHPLIDARRRGRRVPAVRDPDAGRGALAAAADPVPPDGRGDPGEHRRRRARRGGHPRAGRAGGARAHRRRAGPVPARRVRVRRGHCVDKWGVDRWGVDRCGVDRCGVDRCGRRPVRRRPMPGRPARR